MQEHLSDIWIRLRFVAALDKVQKCWCNPIRAHAKSYVSAGTRCMTSHVDVAERLEKGLGKMNKHFWKYKLTQLIRNSNSSLNRVMDGWMDRQTDRWVL